MARYSAFIQSDFPAGFCAELKARRIDSINRAILATGKAWPGLELPQAIKRGHFYAARSGNLSLTIHKDS